MPRTKQFTCPEIPFFGAKYPDATCIDGQLYDIDKCDSDGNLYEMSDYVPCPFCKGEDYVKWHSEYYNTSWKEARKVKNDIRNNYLTTKTINQ